MTNKQLIAPQSPQAAGYGQQKGEQIKAQPEQEPAAWMSQGGDVSRSRKHFKEMGFTNLIPLYTTPPQREWVGLTDEEVVGLYLTIGGDREWAIGGMGDVVPFARAIEAKLKEKNT